MESVPLQNKLRSIITHSHNAHAHKLEATEALRARKAPPGTPHTHYPGHLRQAFTVLAVRCKPQAKTGQLFPGLRVCAFESPVRGVRLKIPRLHSSPPRPKALGLEPGKAPWVVLRQQSSVWYPRDQVTARSSSGCNGPTQLLAICLPLYQDSGLPPSTSTGCTIPNCSLQGTRRRKLLLRVCWPRLREVYTAPKSRVLSGARVCGFRDGILPPPGTVFLLQGRRP